MSRTRIKICGITSVEMALAAAEAGADAVGLVFAKNSPRRIDIDDAIEIVDALPPFVTPVGVFQLASAKDADLDEWWGEWVQLHGGEDEGVVAKVAETHRVIRGFGFDAAQVQRWNRCEHVDALLVEGSSAAGSGTSFDHAALVKIKNDIHKPVILAGGLTPDSVGEAIRTVHPFAVDVSSGVESSRGVKDAALIRRFCEAVRSADH